MATQKVSTEAMPGSPKTEVADPAETIEGRPMRADARRNRELLVAAAKDVFSTQGAGASMEAIAKRAGVGVGTLYRHFPNRLDLVEAVYQTDVEELWESAQRVVAELEPWPAVEAFFEAFRRYAQTKQALMAELHQAFEKNPDMRSRARRAHRVVVRPCHRPGQGGRCRARRRHRIGPRAAGEPRLHQHEHRAGSGRPPPGYGARRLARRRRADSSRLTEATGSISNRHCCLASRPWWS